MHPVDILHVTVDIGNIYKLVPAIYMKYKSIYMCVCIWVIYTKTVAVYCSGP